MQLTSMQTEQVQVNTTQVNITQETVQPNLSCPKPTINPNITVKDKFSNVQNPDMDTKIELNHDSIEVEDVDNYGRYYGGSMSPTLMEDDRLLVEEYSNQELETGMIIRARIQDQNVIHRIVSDHGPDGYVVLSGDSSDAKQRVKISQVTHVVKGVVYG